jgi:PilZ domain
VEQSLADRRVEARFPPSPVLPMRATLRPGFNVRVVNLSGGGALLQGARAFRPGSRVHLQLVTSTRTLVLAAHVLRCAVWALDDLDGVTYRGALRFEQRCESIWDPDPPSRAGNEERVPRK